MSRSRPRGQFTTLTPRGLQGCIFFLKRMRDIHGHCLERYYLEPSVFWHPALILHTDEASKAASICIVSASVLEQQQTSLLTYLLRKLNSLNECIAKDRFPSSECRFYLTVSPKGPPFPDQPQLRLQGKAQLRKSGYINIRREYLVHQTMLQPYDWDQPTNYYRLTHKSFAVVIAKLDTIYYSGRLAKLNAEDFARRLAVSRANEASSIPNLKAINLNADIARLMRVKNSRPSRYLESGLRSQTADPRTPLATTTTKVISRTPEAPASSHKIRLFLFAALLVAITIWARAAPIGVGQLVKKLIETLAHVLIVALGIAWGIGEMIATGFGVLGRKFRHLGWTVCRNYGGCGSVFANGGKTN